MFKRRKPVARNWFTLTKQFFISNPRLASKSLDNSNFKALMSNSKYSYRITGSACNKVKCLLEQVYWTIITFVWLAKFETYLVQEMNYNLWGGECERYICRIISFFNCNPYWIILHKADIYWVGLKENEVLVIWFCLYWNESVNKCTWKSRTD